MTKKQSFKIRGAHAADIDRIAALDAAVTSTPKLNYWTKLFDDSVARPNQHFLLIAERSDKLLGFIAGEIRAWEFGSPPCGWVYGITVDPANRLGGLGAELFAELCAKFRGVGVTKVRTMIARDDRLVMSFFRAQSMMAGPFVELEKDLDE